MSPQSLSRPARHPVRHRERTPWSTPSSSVAGAPTTSPRPLEVEALFPELSAHCGTTTRLHPRPGRPDVADGFVGGPLLGPADHPWPVGTEPHGHARGRRPADIHRWRQILAATWLSETNPGPTDEERQLLKKLEQEHRVEEAAATAPLPLIGLAQLYRRVIPDLPAGPDDCDPLQVFWRAGPWAAANNEGRLFPGPPVAVML